MISRTACGLQDEKGKVDMRKPIKFDLLCSLGHVTRSGTGCGNAAWAGRERGDNGDINVRGDAVSTKHEVHAGMFDLMVHHTGDTWGMVCSMHTLVPLCV